MHPRHGLCKYPEVKGYQKRREDVGRGWRGREEVNQKGLRNLVPLSL